MIHVNVNCAWPREKQLRGTAGLGGGEGLQNWIVKYFFDVALELFLQKSDWQPF